MYVIDDATDEVGFSTHSGMCTFHDTVTPITQVPVISTIVLTNDDTSAVSIPKGVMITLTGIFE